MLPKETFSEIIRHTPLVAIDFVIKNDNQEILLGLRNNLPARNHWFVPGGRIYKNETIQAAKTRILQTEVGIKYEANSDQLIGLYEHIYNDNTFGMDGFGTHYVVSGWRIELAEFNVTKDSQHESLEWWPIADALENPKVHSLTKAYLKDLG